MLTTAGTKGIGGAVTRRFLDLGADALPVPQERSLFDGGTVPTA